MNALQRLRRRLDAEFGQQAILRELAQVLASHEAELVMLLREQLMEGKMPGSRGREKRIRPRYVNDIYARKKQGMNPKPGYKTPDLRKTGAFHRSITVETSVRGVAFDASDKKKEELLDKYGNVLALSKERWAAFVDEYLEDELRTRLKHKAKKLKKR